MAVTLQEKLLGNLSSPYGLATVSSAIFLLAVLFPPSVYYFYIGEPDLIFLNWEAFLYFGSCVLAFFCGLRLFSAVAATPERRMVHLNPANPLLFLLLPLLAGTAVSLLSTAALATSLPNLATLLLSQQGDLVKLAGLSGSTSVGYWRTSSIFATGTLWWAYWRGSHIELVSGARRIFSLCVFGSLAFDVVACIVRVDRTALMPIVAGLFVFYLHRRIAEQKASLVRAATLGLTIAAMLIGIFVLLSFVRGAAGLKTLISIFLGYTIVSYNRLAALLSGQMTYLYHGTGIYLSSAYASDVNNLLHLQNLPTPTDAWFSEFTSTASAGLNPMFIWSGAFGYLYSDLAWWTPVFVFALGLLYGAAWRSFLRQSAVGLTVYPWFAFNILFWIGSNYLLDTKLLMLVLTGLGLAFYENAFGGKRVASTPS